ncbi:MAG: hypothetical protein V1492_06130 [Candidatus Micrarchaeota archaeon]
MRLQILFALLLLATVAYSEFMLEDVLVSIHDIQPDGSARVTENIKLIITGDQSQAAYDSGFSSNDISFWTSITALPDMKYHVNPAKVSISDLRVRPQPRKKCNPIQGICHGEVVIEYSAKPISRENANISNFGSSGLFMIDAYKPRTTRYKLDPDALSFLSTPQGDILLAENIHLKLVPPADSVAMDLNPKPDGFTGTLPTKIGELTWSDTILVKFSVIFEVEEPLEKEVSGFFYGILSGFQGALTGQYGWAVIAMIIIIVGGYIYITLEKRSGGS